MRVRLCLSALLALAITSEGFAQENKFQRFDVGWNVLSYSRQGSTNGYGGDLSFAVHASDRLAIVSEFTLHKATVSGMVSDTVTYRFGPRVSQTFGTRLTTFGEILAGGSRLTGGAVNFSAGTAMPSSEAFHGFALAIGGGVDVGIKRWLAFRAVQADYNLLRFGQLDETSNGVRIGTGFVFRFGS